MSNNNERFKTRSNELVDPVGQS